MHAKAVPFYGCMHILCKYIRLREAINKIIMIFWSLRKCSRERERERGVMEVEGRWKWRGSGRGERRGERGGERERKRHWH